MTRAVLMICVLFVAGCGEDSADEHANHEAAGIEDNECAACGMIVRDQPSPRGQLVHRDGTRAHFCSIADLVTYSHAPSPHGAPEATYVEVMAPDADPDELSTEELAWLPVTEAAFVFGGIERPVMGEAILTFANMEEARAAAQRLDARAVTWDELREALGGDGRATTP